MVKLRSELRTAFTRLFVRTNKVDGYSMLELIIVIILGTIATPALVSMFTTVFTNSHASEIMTVADFLAIEQMEIILADKAGTGAGYGYPAITMGNYPESETRPGYGIPGGGPFWGYFRKVLIWDKAAGGGSPPYVVPYAWKKIEVYVSHYFFSARVRIHTMIFDHSGLP